VVTVHDYKLSLCKNLKSGTTEDILIPKSDVLIYTTEDGTRVALRPSGTEPKIKFYLSVNCPLNCANDFSETEKLLNTKINAIITEMNFS
jgi:phosphomannomutase